ncbi:MAG: translocation/assembly module TamB domain-containing protein [Methylococcales bacterium]|nr:translocation/assembly module TamB domain-containing protein [Methylococcales bacterium]
MKKRIILLIAMLIVLIIPAGLAGLMSSEAGSQWLLRKVISVLPARVSVAAMKGRLIDRISLTDFHYQTDAETLVIDDLVFAWQPDKLLSGTLKITDIIVNGLNVTVIESKEPQEKSSFDLNAELPLPVQVIIENLLLTDAQFHIGDFVQELEKLQLAVATEDDQLKIMSIDVNAHPFAATVRGRITLGKGFPFNLKLDWQANAEQNGLWQGSTILAGDINQLTFDNQIASPFIVVLKGNLEDLQTMPRINARADWNKAVWPIGGVAPRIKSEQGAMEMTGLLKDYKITLNGQLTQQYLPEASLSFNGRGSQNALSIEKLELKSKTGVFQVNGDVFWKDAPAFDLTAAGRNFNPAILLPELPGNLTFSSHLKGNLKAEALQLDTEINSLSGQLRGKPVSADGKLALNGDQLKVDALHINSGVNKITVNGAMGQENAALELAIDTPALDAFWPTLGGSLKGDGLIQGTWKKPAVKFQAKGRQLHFAGHSAGQLAINIDYTSDPKKTSTMLLSANAVKSGEVQIDSVRVDGLGALAQHNFKADIKSPDGNLSTLLTGSLNAGHWKGDFSRLDLNSRDLGLWQLKKNMAVNIIQRPAGVDVAIDEVCLVQKSASLCTHGHYFAGGDLDFALKVAEFPTRLLKAYMPEQMQLNGLLNTDTEMQKRKGLFTGRYQLELSPSTLLFQGKKVSLGASSLSGNIKGNTVFADINMALAGQDYIRSRLQMDTGKSQAISGAISASMRELSLLEAFVPQLSGTKGLLTADLKVGGTVKKPVVMGQIDLAKGAVDIAGQGVGLRDINLHATASGKQANRIQINGSVLPTELRPANSPEQVQLTGPVTINADLQQQEGVLAGHYRIDSPPLTILLQTNEGATRVSLGASSVSGNIKGENVSADIDLRLVGRDYLRAQLQMDTGKTQALSGQITASIVEFASLNQLAPQLSNIKGQLKADMALQGNLEKPQASGAIRFTGGAVDVNEQGIALREIKLQAVASGDKSDRINITGSARSGGGQLNIDGFASLQAQAGWPVELMLKGENFEISKTPEAQIAISPDLKYVSADTQGKVSGKLKIPKAIIKLKELPQNAVKVSPDEIIIGEAKAEEKKAVAPGIDANIDVELGKQVNFSGQGLETGLTGQLKIVKAAEKMAMHGNVDMIKGRYKSYGQDLTVRKGRFVFNGPVDNPWLDVEAIRVSNSKKVTAILSLTGSLEKPQTRISSEPSLPEAEALAYLVTGRPLSQVSQSEGNLLASAALSYGGGQAAWLTKKLGIDEFEVQEGETLQDTLVAVGQYLTPDFYVGAKVGLFNNQAAMVLKHKVTDAINVETQAGTSQRVKINYEINTD